ncbi:MAG: hypothetical protein H0X51_05530 [Parachlamydiaceae bacterium]|nr:hypothetical protein [Parachlamydiaceae bacterium]
MWWRAYRDYKIDQPLIKYPVYPSHGIIGCEMHEINGWGSNYHIPAHGKGRFEHLPHSPNYKKTENKS